LLNNNQAALTAGHRLIHSQSDELSGVTRPPLREKQPNGDPAHKQMIYLRKEKKKPIASCGLTREPKALAIDRVIKQTRPAGQNLPGRIKKLINTPSRNLSLDRKLTFL
jgi:hypothetical protein